MSINDFRNEINELFKNSPETTSFRNDDGVLGEYYNEFYREMLDNTKAICIINCEYNLSYKDDINKIHAHYNDKYWGSADLNALLTKYRYRYEWYDTCIALVYTDYTYE